MEIKEIKELLRAFDHSSATTFSLKDEGFSLQFEKAAPVVASAVTAAVPVQATAALSAVVSESEEAPAVFQAPLPGTFFAAAAPDAEPFVAVGDRVEKGQTIGIIEAMKVMNEVPAAFSGRIAAIHIQDGQVVGYNDTLMTVDRDDV